jgi:hypothetical protein
MCNVCSDHEIEERNGPGWGSLEYGTPTKGQVIGGRWKILHHVLQQSAFADVIASCGVSMASTGAGEYGKAGIAGSTANGSAWCYVRNDLPDTFVGRVIVDVIHLNTGSVTQISSVPVTSLPTGNVGFLCAANSSTLLPPNAYRKVAEECPTFAELYRHVGCAAGAADCILNVTVVSDGDSGADGGTQISRSVLPLTKPSDLRLPMARVRHRVQGGQPAGSRSVQVTLTTNATAIFVWLSTAEQGRFSDNALVLLPGVDQTVDFLSFVSAGTSSVALEASLRVEHLGMYILPDVHAQRVDASE